MSGVVENVCPPVISIRRSIETRIVCEIDTVTERKNAIGISTGLETVIEIVTETEIGIVETTRTGIVIVGKTATVIEHN